MSMDSFGVSGSGIDKTARFLAASDEDSLRQSKRKRNEALGEDFDRLALATNAMWELLQEAFPKLTVDILMEKMHEIDGRDGLYDTSTRRPASRCPAEDCGATVPSGQSRCQFCGTEVPVGKDPFAF